MEVSTLAAFAATWFVLGLSPGPNAAFCLAVGLAQPGRTAMAAPIGIGLASFVHAAVAAVGAGAVFARWPAAFQVLKFAGVAYLAWLGIKQWRTASHTIAATTTDATHTTEILRRGLIVSLTNPKAVLQYVAVLPQFVDPTEPVVLQFVFLALVAAPVVAAVYAIYTGAAALIASRLTEHRTVILRRATGGIYLIAAGLLSTR